ncbi:hypothetical protein [Isoptericola aurantiacus]|uniref:hypothetical protein n=1 Tax=Isoptericola aurantiacus TaxID=3377839 RepID=UPI003839E437
MTPPRARDAGADAVPPDTPEAAPSSSRQRSVRKQVLLRLDPAIHAALARWAADDLRSVNAQIDMVLRRALAEAGRLPRDARPARRPGRPARPRQDEGPAERPDEVT